MIEQVDIDGVLKRCLNKGAEQAEIFLEEDNSIRAQYEHGSLKLLADYCDVGIAIRVKTKNSIGFSFSNSLEPKLVDYTIDRALEVAKMKKSDPNCLDFPEPKTYVKVEGICDSKIQELTVDGVTDLAERVLEIPQSYRIRGRLIATFGLIELHKMIICLNNSMGVDTSYGSTFILGGLRTLYKEGSEVGNGYQSCFSRSLDGFSPENIGEESCKHALKSIKARSIETVNTDIILEPSASYKLLMLLGSASLAKNVQEKRSFLLDSVGQEIATEDVTVLDDARYPGGLASCPVDDEGAPTGLKPIIEKGVLKRYLYDIESAKKEGLETTGNGLRCTFYPDFRKYRYRPSVGITNFVLKEGEMTKEELIEETRDGILITFLVGGGDEITGGFSAEIRNGYKIDNGEVTYPIKQASFSGNLLDILKKIKAIANNSCQTQASIGVGQGSYITPSMKIDKVKIVGE